MLGMIVFLKRHLRREKETLVTHLVTLFYLFKLVAGDHVCIVQLVLLKNWLGENCSLPLLVYNVADLGTATCALE
jgi:hypothetical protein